MSSVRQGGSRRFVWLASWPKSGNTWVRCLLTNFLSESNEPVSIDNLVGHSATDMKTFDTFAGIPSSHCTDDEAESLRPSVYRFQAAAEVESGHDGLLFSKVHDAFRTTASGESLFPTAVTAGAVYVMRNPLDVAVSGAFHWGIDMSKAVAALNNPLKLAGRNTDQLRQRIGNWSSHVENWTRGPRFPVLALRYEDLLAEPLETLARIVRFLNLNGDDDGNRLRRAVEFSSFARSREAEDQHGFLDRSPHSRRFFRSGRAGDWRHYLTSKQARAVLEAHGPVMEMWGYDCGALLGELHDQASASASVPGRPGVATGSSSY